MLLKVLMLTITIEKRRALRAEAHALKPIVMIGNAGLTDAVIKEIENALTNHELMKIRVFSDEKDARETILQAICERIGAAPIQHIGKILVIYKPSEKIAEAKKIAAKKTGTAKASPSRRPRSVAKTASGKKWTARDSAAVHATVRNAAARGEPIEKEFDAADPGNKKRRFATGSGSTIKHGGLSVRRKRTT